MFIFINFCNNDIIYFMESILFLNMYYMSCIFLLVIIYDEIVVYYIKC